MPLTPSLCQVNSHIRRQLVLLAALRRMWLRRFYRQVARRREGFKAAPFADALHDDP